MGPENILCRSSCVINVRRTVHMALWKKPDSPWNVPQLPNETSKFRQSPDSDSRRTLHYPRGRLVRYTSVRLTVENALPLLLTPAQSLILQGERVTSPSLILQDGRVTLSWNMLPTLL